MFNQRQPQPHSAATLRAVSNTEAIEWEELPSLTQRVVHRGANDSAFTATRNVGTVWDNTMPAALDTVPVSLPFAECIEGLATREVNEPGVFRHFFGEFAPAR